MKIFLYLKINKHNLNMYSLCPMSIFYNSNKIHKILIKSLYKDYMNELNNFEILNTNYTAFILDNNEKKIKRYVKY